MSEQGTPEWFARRLGKFTGSRFVDVLAKSKRDGKPLKAYEDLIWTLVVERLTGQRIDGPDGYAIQWGKDVEPFAREAYELKTGEFVEQIDFVDHPDLPFVGCSPDGLVGTDGGIEMKCPKNSSIHLQRFLDGMPEEYIPQVQGCMWVTGRRWWDFVSYDPRMPEPYRLFIRRIARDDAYIKALESAVVEAEASVVVMLDKLQKSL